MAKSFLQAVGYCLVYLKYTYLVREQLHSYLREALVQDTGIRVFTSELRERTEN